MHQQEHNVNGNETNEPGANLRHQGVGDIAILHEAITGEPHFSARHGGHETQGKRHDHHGHMPCDVEGLIEAGVKTCVFGPLVLPS